MGTSPERKEYLKEYYAKRRESIRAKRKRRYLDIREWEIDRVQKAKAKGKPEPATPRKTRPGAPIRRRWTVIGEEIYFNSGLGYSSVELTTALRDLNESLLAREQWDLRALAKRRSARKRDMAPKRRAQRKEWARKHRRGEDPGPVSEIPVANGPRLSPIKRKWMVLRSRLYFTPTQPLLIEELMEAMRRQQAEIRKQKDSSPARLAPDSSPRARVRENSTA